MSGKIKFGFSPCPNDTFILDALFNNKIDTKGLEFDWVIEDVEQLNKLALSGQIDLTKLSYGVYPKIHQNYQLLDAGSALGQACGPLVIYKELPKDLSKAKIAIPGINTTANFLLSMPYPQIDHKIEFLFSDIEEAVQNEKVELGLIIHENRFTYLSKGLHLLEDLGAFWENKTGNHIPLGGFAVKRTLKEPIKQSIQELIRESVQFAFKNPESSKDWIKSYAQETEDLVIQSHIDLYVNEFSINLGQTGRDAIQFLMDQSNLDKKNQNIFL